MSTIPDLETATLVGDFGRMPVTDLLHWIRLGRRRGMLVCRGESFRKEVFFDEGNPFFASSNIDRERLGTFLVGQGNLTPGQLERCLEIWTEWQGKLKLGEIVTSLGLMDPKALSRRLAELVEEIIWDLFVRREGTFAFFEDHIPAVVRRAMRVQPRVALLERLWRLDAYRRRAGGLPPADLVLRPVSGRDQSGLEDRQKKILALIDGARTVQEILNHAPVTRLDSHIALVALLEEGIVEPMTERESVPPQDEIHLLLGQAEEHLQWGDLVGTRRLFARILRRLTRLDQGETELARLQEAVVDLSARLEAAVTREALRLAGGMERRLVPASQKMNQRLEATLSPEQVFLLTRVGRGATLAELVHLSGQPRPKALYDIYWLLLTGLLYPDPS